MSILIKDIFHLTYIARVQLANISIHLNFPDICVWSVRSCIATVTIYMQQSWGISIFSILLNMNEFGFSIIIFHCIIFKFSLWVIHIRRVYAMETNYATTRFKVGGCLLSHRHLIVTRSVEMIRLVVPWLMSDFTKARTRAVINRCSFNHVNKWVETNSFDGDSYGT